jgi:DNA-3-methyladenine glycosylase
MHACLNVVTGPEGDPAAVLIRAVEPLKGIAAMRTARSWTAERRAGPGRGEARRERLAGIKPARLAAGPGLVCEALGITRRLNGTDLLDPGAELRLELDIDGLDPETERVNPDVMASERIGIGYAPEPWRSLQWRFHLRDHPAVSLAAPVG